MTTVAALRYKQSLTLYCPHAVHPDPPCIEIGRSGITPDDSSGEIRFLRTLHFLTFTGKTNAEEKKGVWRLR
jgi:hypothetical protein